MLMITLLLSLLSAALVITAVLAFLTVFRFGNPPKTYVMVEDCFRLPLLKVLMVELLALGMLGCATSFLTDRHARSALAEAEERNKALTLKNDFLIGDVIRYWSQLGNGENGAKVSRWLTENHLADTSLEFLCYRGELSTVRERLVRELGVRSQIVLQGDTHRLGAAAGAMTKDGYKTSVESRSNGTTTLRASESTSHK